MFLGYDSIKKPQGSRFLVIQCLKHVPLATVKKVFYLVFGKILPVKAEPLMPLLKNYAQSGRILPAAVPGYRRFLHS